MEQVVNSADKRIKPEMIHTGLLVLRVGIGIMFMIHGWPKLMGGQETWVSLGGAMGVFGITFAPAFWGFIASIAEFAGGIALITGILVRPFALLMFVTMCVAAAMHISGGDGFSTYSHPVEAGIVFLSLLISGGGRYTLGSLIRGLKKRRSK